MKNFKKIAALALSVCAVIGAVSLSACAKKGNDGKEPVTTVANEQEWKTALDIFAKDSFTVAERIIAMEFDENVEIIGNGYVDMANCKANFKYETEDWENYYFEYSDNKMWEYNGERVYGTSVNSSDTKKFLKDRLIEPESVASCSLVSPPYPAYAAVGDKENAKPLSDLFAQFTYKDGYYVSDSIQFADDIEDKVEFKIGIKNCVMSEFIMVLKDKDSGSVIITYIGKFSNINATSVTAPEGARAAIDAERAKG